MAITFRLDVHVYHHEADAGTVRAISALTQLMRSHNDQLAEAVSELSGQARSSKPPRSWKSSTRSETVSTPSMEQAIEQLRAEIERNSSVDDSAIQLLSNLADKIEELKNSPAELTTLVESLRSQSDALAAAVVANTPAAENPPA
jgi:chromosome segregation ATPase